MSSNQVSENVQAITTDGRNGDVGLIVPLVNYWPHYDSVLN